tara:strand:- start:10508 stop:11131 length:624 start_codon:yes stop_codon:yes gene_type:complete
MRLLLIIPILLSVACSKLPVEIDESLVDYVQEAVNISEEYGDNFVIEEITIKKAVMSKSKHGQCITQYDSFGNLIKRVVEVNSNSWDYLSHQAKIIVLMHELGHCLKSYGHRDFSVNRDYLLDYYGIEMAGSSYIGSIMNSTCIACGMNEFQNLEKYYYEEFFDPEKKRVPIHDVDSFNKLDNTQGFKKKVNKDGSYEIRTECNHDH